MKEGKISKTHEKFNKRMKERHEENLKMYDKSLKYVGFSLSFCVSDILNGYMPKECVVGMNTSTRMETFIDVQGVCERYSTAPWSDKEPRLFGQKDEDSQFSMVSWRHTIVWLMLNTKFIQPRLRFGDDAWSWGKRRNEWHWDKWSPDYENTLVADRHWLAVDPDKFNKYINESKPNNLKKIARRIK